MRVIVSGGGTGGHIYPALTLVNAIREKVSDAEFLYVGTKHGLEADIIPKEGIPFATVDIQGFKRSLSPENILRGVRAIEGVVEAMGVVKRFRPDVAIGTGGYVCGPILLASSLMKVPTLIQEQNAVPGITNEILSHFVTRIAVGVKVAAEKFPAKKTIFTGNPVRSEIIRASREDGMRKFGLSRDKKTLLASGGSQGARSINMAMTKVIQNYAGDERVQILLVSGRGDYDDTLSRIREAGLDIASAKNIFIEPYLYDMPLALATADLAIFRAGAISIAELTARGIPSVLVPYPYATANHQEHNARAVVDAGAARMILDADLTAERLLPILEELLSDEEKLSRMARAAEAIGRPDAADEIASLAIELADGGRSGVSGSK